MDISGVVVASSLIASVIVALKALDFMSYKSMIEKIAAMPTKKGRSKKKKKSKKHSLVLSNVSKGLGSAVASVEADNLIAAETVEIILKAAILSSNKLAVQILISANAGLYKTMLLRLFNANKNNKGAKEANAFNLTIAEMLFTTKAKHSLYAYAFIATTAILHFTWAALTSQDINHGLLLFLAIAFALIHLNQKILEFRIGRGFYGKNEYEAREMVLFLMSHADKTDFTDSDGLKKLFPEVKENDRELEAVNGLLGVPQ